MDDLVTFIEARLADDERIALGAGRGVWEVEHHTCWEDHCDEPCESAVRCRLGECDDRVIDGYDLRIYDEGGHNGKQADHIARHDPARILREVEAKRRLLEEHPDDEEGFCGDGIGLVGCHWAYPCPTVRLLAAPFADHPDFRVEWGTTDG